MTNKKSPTWLRGLQIGLGLIILFLSIMVLMNPIFGTISVIFFLAFLLLFAGIEKIISGIFIPGKSRFANIGLGLAVMILSMIALSYPVGTGIFVVMLLGIALLADGISRIVHGFRDRQVKKWLKGFGVVAGILSIILGIVVMVLPGVGLVFAGILIGIALLITGIQIISEGFAGENRQRQDDVRT